MANQPITEDEMKAFRKNFRTKGTVREVVAKLGVTEGRAKTILLRANWIPKDIGQKPYTWGPR